MSDITIYHIPVCPFSQRVKILLSLKGAAQRVRFEVIDITVPRPDWLLELTGGTTALPVLVEDAGRVLKESLVILRYLEELLPDTPVARTDPYERAVERMLIAQEGGFTETGYRMILNQDRDQTAQFREKMDAFYLGFSRFLERHATGDTFLFDRFGLAEAVFTPIFQRFWFLDHYEGYQPPSTPDTARARRWHDACIAHPDAQQVSRREIVTLYYDYALGAGNGALPPGRNVSSFTFTPDWRDRPLPPPEKYGASASDAELGLL
ncbi:glutathione S-transferase family protein [Tropicimonas sediminicola]|uniref:Glutathione S-transferase n=1 Tax=Tropicimonas sediminicola TaxID=1031541 RepID=A0A239KDP6_9RHOB|nr:glutathione S-transferase family protein [Tropicimonas sediminicola]SNT16477.1 glutathione S-transferase [Tropicimonas sediminicola]